MEIIVVFFMFGIFVALTTVSLKRSIQQEGPRGLAYTIAADLRAARAEAQRTGSLTAYCLPNEGNIQFSRSAVTRRGEQLGQVQKVHGYEGDFQAYIFVGGWAGAITPPTLASLDLSPTWEASIEDQFTIFFRPDGTAFSPNIPSVEGQFPLVVGTAFRTGGGGGGLAGLQQVTDPFTVWVSRSGGVRVQEFLTPAGVLGPGGEAPTEVAKLDLDVGMSGGSPRILGVGFLPSKVDGIDHGGVGLNYTQIHPEQKGDNYVEYSLATFDIRAEDPSGGPLFYEVTATATTGGAEEGRFSAFRSSGRMAYRPHQAHSGSPVWNSVVSWRPPPSAPADTEYEFEIRVFNRDGGEDTARSGAGLLPLFKTLGTPRIAIQTLDQSIYLATIEASSLVQVSDPEIPEVDPFFSNDGTRLYTFSEIDGVHRMYTRNADGTGFDMLVELPAAPGLVAFDPLYQFVAYVYDQGTVDFPYKTPTYHSGTDDGDGYWEFSSGVSSRARHVLEIMHLNSGQRAVVTNTLRRRSSWQWDTSDPAQRFRLSYEVYQPTPMANHPSLGPYRPSPGFEEVFRTGNIVGLPPSIIDTPGGTVESGTRNRIYHPSIFGRFLERLEVVEGPPKQFSLSLRDALSTEVLLTSGYNVSRPAWAANGRALTYSYRPDEASPIRLCVRSYAGGVVGPEVVILELGGISQPKLSPDADYAFYRQGGNLWRVPVSGGTPVNLTSGAIDSSVQSYDITR